MIWELLKAGSVYLGIVVIDLCLGVLAADGVEGRFTGEAWRKEREKWFSMIRYGVGAVAVISCISIAHGYRGVIYPLSLTVVFFFMCLKVLHPDVSRIFVRPSLADNEAIITVPQGSTSFSSVTVSYVWKYRVIHAGSHKLRVRLRDVLLDGEEIILIPERRTFGFDMRLRVRQDPEYPKKFYMVAEPSGNDAEYAVSAIPRQHSRKEGLPG